MYTGEPSSGKEFYKLLLGSQEFCAELGRVTLAASQLEAELILLLKRKGVTHKVDGLTLGRLVRSARAHGALDQKMLAALQELCGQRNYLTHNIYALFIELISETILARSNLIDTDVEIYIERARQLRENLLGIAAIMEEQ